MMLKKRLLGLDRQNSKDEGVLADLPPDTYLGKLVRQLVKSDHEGYMTEEDLSVLLDFEEE